jgi:hypothetical protein
VRGLQADAKPVLREDVLDQVRDLDPEITDSAFNLSHVQESAGLAPRRIGFAAFFLLNG